MSSEESDTETNGRGIEAAVFHVRRMGWRRWMEEELAIIDGSHTYTRTRGGRGARLVERRRNNRHAESTRNPVPNLPEAFYDSDWLKARSPEYREMSLRVSKEKFKWLRTTREG
jgi:hypothetical protein